MIALALAVSQLLAPAVVCRPDATRDVVCELSASAMADACAWTLPAAQVDEDACLDAGGGWMNDGTCLGTTDAIVTACGWKVEE